MKTAVAVGLFVLVACLQLQADAAKIKRAVCTEPEGPANTCQLRSCNEETGLYTVQRCGDVIGVVRCTGNTVQDNLPEDLSKPFPECCARPYCRDL